MLKSLKQIVYVKIETNCLIVLNASSGKKVEARGDFSNQRLAVANFMQAEKLLRNAITKVCDKGLLSASPTVVIHQIYKNEGGLSEVELRVLNELGLGAGARQVTIWQGNSLTREQLQNGAYITSS